MTEIENLLVTASEECAEISQAISKALRFGLSAANPDESPERDNADDIMTEFLQLDALVRHLQMMGAIPIYDFKKVTRIEEKKMGNVKKWQSISRMNGTLEGGTGEND